MKYTMKHTMTIRGMALCMSILALTLAPTLSLSAQTRGSTTGGNSSDADVPDIETRIRNSGNNIPAQAIPAVPVPAPTTLPELPAEPVPPVLPPVVPTVATAIAEPVPSAPPVATNDNPLSGYVRLGAGSPGTLLGDLSVRRAEGTLPALALAFLYTSADGYGPAKSGTGFFDRAANVSFSASKTLAKTAENSSWFADIALSDGANGLQGMNPRYYSLTRRDVAWSLGLRSLPLGASAFSLSATADGSVNSVFAEGPTATPNLEDAVNDTTLIDDFAGYRLSPSLALAFAKGAFKAEISGRYGYETALDSGEMHSGEGELSLRYGIGSFGVHASGGVAGDGGSGGAGTDGVGDAGIGDARVGNAGIGDARVSFPFEFGVDWKPARDALSSDAASLSLYLEELNLSGGITRERWSSVTLAKDEPFVDPSGLSVYSADWAASGAFALGLSAPNGSVLSASAGAEYRKSLAGHGILSVTDMLTGASLVALRRVERSSLVTKADAAWNARGFALDARYSGEWLDRLDRRSLHTAAVGASVFDSDADRVWEVGAEFAFALDHAEYPVLSANGTARPFRNFAVTLSLVDVLPLIAGEARTRNGLYEVRSGELTLSAKLDF